MKRIIFIFFLVLFSISIQSQNKYPQNFFRSPIDFRILLSGTFGELRSDHFHTGIDIKTRGVVGAKVHAAADGYVSRVKVSTYGYGKSIYITHPNGFVTVYGHLNSFEDSLAAYVKSEQYRRKSFEVDLYLKKDQFKYTKGEVIALSGNSGGSGGPHLHFEIRDEKTQEPLNPLLFGIEVKDFIRPSINSVRVYPTNKMAFNLVLSGWGENYHIRMGDTVRLPKQFYLGIDAIDKQNDTENKNGVFEVELFVDSVKVFGNRQERLNFSTGRYINAFIDYSYYSRYKNRFQRSFVGEHNKLDIYTEVKKGGLIDLDDSKYHQIIYKVKDANGNTSKLQFYAYLDNSAEFEVIPKDTLQKAIFYADKVSVFEADNVKISLPEYALYDDLSFVFDMQESNTNTYSPIYQIHKDEVPLHKYIKLDIKADSIPENYKDKIGIARVEKDQFIMSNTEWNGPWASASIRNFGDYTLVADTVKPIIRMYKAKNTTSLVAGQKISFLIKDELSGIKTYRGLLNGKWVLFEYDAKNDLLFHIVEEKSLSKENIIEIEVEDRVGNKNQWERKFNKG